MYIVLGAAGNVGSRVIEALRPAGEKIFALVHSEQKASTVDGGNVEAVVLDVLDSAALRALFQRGRRAFLLNPPAHPGTDTNAEELKTARSIAAALKDSDLEKLVVQSTYGARQGDGIGDLSVLYEFERLAEASGIPAAINRAAYYYTNFDMLLEPARKGLITTAFPEDFILPMVSPADLGKVAAARLAGSVGDVGINYVEGPRRYAFADVAAAFSAVVGKSVKVKTTPRGQLEESFRKLGFSPSAARSYTRMTEATLDGPELPREPNRGEITLEDHIAALR
ncbi:NAD(P)H-binding protein [Rhizobium leguminosarum bv. viciae]|uniref:NAD(P)H-binding protein n=1 Tax=Rhizobium leguminosarum bv. viciae TaxID=387 RepID=A0A8I2KG13_RHILV|nr:NmrA family NAD(P)-binding protein [Rhizobium leguminosarum]ASR05836.1 NmrA family transcriptional regulator [Rhizobium leguminosarum bv. viciae]MBY5754463.1 NmrA family NAD(P)-binding protein [Rhizobium leguminosarum]MBY5791232.1 NmrA family NAD(P)-binding protein [Rhizobium leguminosarum]MBY5798095.1 NmrA family NAD(P)-binding protein [Rhizobium leguminosarum]MBY5823811.1 NmrA family NAD(P)-binding protein [Rhizobium leguminosarum]